MLFTSIGIPFRGMVLFPTYSTALETGAKTSLGIVISHKANAQRALPALRLLAVGRLCRLTARAMFEMLFLGP